MFRKGALYSFILYNYITVHGVQNIKLGIYFCNPHVIEIQRYHLFLHTCLKSQQMIRKDFVKEAHHCTGKIIALHTMKTFWGVELELHMHS